MTLSYNERQVLELIFLGETPSRIEMAQVLGLTGASLTRIVSRLREDGLIEEKAEKNGQQGQPRRGISIIPGHHYSAGVNFSRRQVQLTLLDLAGLIMGTKSIPISEPTAQQIVEATTSGLASLLKNNGLNRADLVGFGISIPGNFGRNALDFRAHELFPEIEGLSFTADLVSLFDAPVFLENDGSCAALGEYMFGAGRGINHLFLIHIGHGFGGGGILNGRLFRGAHGNACLPGPIFPIGTPRPSGQDLLNFLTDKGFGGLELTDHELNDAELRAPIEQWIERAGDQLGRAASIITGLFDPKSILLGGRLPAWINEALAERARQFSDMTAGPSRGLRTVPLTASKLGQHSGSIGAASLPLFANYFSGAVDDSFSNYKNGRRLNPDSVADQHY